MSKYTSMKYLFSYARKESIEMTVKDSHFVSSLAHLSHPS